MRLQEQIKKDLAAAMKARDEEKKSIIRVIMGEFGRQSSKEIDDDEAVRILKKLIKSEKEVLAQQGLAESNHYIEVIEGYLPKTATDQEIRNWIAVNIDFSKYKNKMQAMGTIMAQFGAAADGNAVKKILQEYQS